MPLTARIAGSAPAPLDVVGAFKTFGPFGPPYEVVAPMRRLDDGDWMMQVRLLETGEDVEYRYAHVLDDPIAA
jgi:hypothetical protein